VVGGCPGVDTPGYHPARFRRLNENGRMLFIEKHPPEFFEDRFGRGL